MPDCRALRCAQEGRLASLSDLDQRSQESCLLKIGPAPTKSRLSLARQTDGKTDCGATAPKAESGPKLGPDQVPTKRRRGQRSPRGAPRAVRNWAPTKSRPSPDQAPSSPGPEVTAPMAESGPKRGPDQVPTKLAGAKGHHAGDRGRSETRSRPSPDQACLGQR